MRTGTARGRERIDAARAAWFVPNVTPPGALEEIVRQVRAVRLRRNAVAVQRGVYRVATVLGAGGALLVVVALRGGRIAFALGLVAVAGATTAGAVSGLRIARRSWLRRRDTAAWIDREAALQSRLVTLLGLRRAPASAFEALLFAQTVERTDRFRPHRLVPHLVPWRPLAAASAAALALAAAIAVAPLLRPPPPRVLVGDRRSDFVVSGPLDPEGASALLVAPGRDQTAGEGPPDGPAQEQAAPGETLADLSDDLQDWVREALWGEAAWDAGEDSGAGDGARDPAARPRSPRQRRPPAGQGTEAATDVDPSAEDGRADQARAVPADAPAEATRTQEGAAGRGAGTGTDPNLFGRPHDTRIGGDGRFELAIAARVRTRPGGAFDPSAGAPAPEPDRNPTLGAAQRAEQPAHRMPLPPGWQDVVRRLFVHQPSEPPA